MTGSPDLPDANRDQPPAFTSATTCREWLAHLPLVNPVQAGATLISQIHLLNRFAIPAMERLRILETLREPAHFVIGECARRFTGKALPLAPAESSLVDANLRLYRALATGYYRCLQACVRGEEGASQAAIVAQRVLAEMAGEQHDSYLVCRMLPSSFWQRMYALFETAERLGVASSEVSDKLFSNRPTTVQAMFAYIVLVQRSSPHELTQRQNAIVRGLIKQWAELAAISASRNASAKMPPLVVDLASSEPATAQSPTGGELRWLDLDGIAGKLRRRISGLQKGATPESLGLGPDCRQPACEQLLRHTYEHCCKGGVTREQPRRPIDTACRLAVGMEAAYYGVSGSPFRQPQAYTSLSAREIEEIATFGRVSTREREDGPQQAVRAETWQLVDDSPAGGRVARSLANLGARMARNQMLAMAVSGGFVLGIVRWILITEDATIQMGIRLLPGNPEPAVLRPAGPAHVRDNWQPGFLLPQVSVLKEVPTLVLPSGWHKDGRIIEIFGAPNRSLRLGNIVERGHDYDRAIYQPL